MEQNIIEGEMGQYLNGGVMGGGVMRGGVMGIILNFVY